MLAEFNVTSSESVTVVEREFETMWQMAIVKKKGKRDE